MVAIKIDAFKQDELLGNFEILLDPMEDEEDFNDVLVETVYSCEVEDLDFDFDFDQYKFTITEFIDCPDLNKDKGFKENPSIEILLQIKDYILENKYNEYVVTMLETAFKELYSLDEHFVQTVVDAYVTSEYLCDLGNFCEEHLKEMNGYKEETGYNPHNPFHYIDQEYLISEYRNEVFYFEEDCKEEYLVHVFYV